MCIGERRLRKVNRLTSIQSGSHDGFRFPDGVTGFLQG